MAVKTCLLPAGHCFSPLETAVPLPGGHSVWLQTRARPVDCQKYLKAVTIQQGSVAPLPTMPSHQMHSSHPSIHLPCMCQALCLVLQKLQEEKHSPCLQGTPKQTEKTIWVTDALIKVCPGCCGNTEIGYLTNAGWGWGRGDRERIP